MKINRFAQRLLTWFDQHGRKHLPWQQDKTPYKVWLSEIMLQQTQVSTVIPYFQRFIECYPTVADLAQAPIDDVLALWSGLGYYARARNLHRCASIIHQQFNNEFPKSIDAYAELPGIGPSTAAAILSIAFGQATAILDGNVKRVLARLHAIPGWPDKTSVKQQLWQIADQYMPNKRCADYTQAIMDLGATLCTRSKPDCAQCPFQKDCQAYQTDKISQFPGKKPKKKIPTKTTNMLLILAEDAPHILLEKRPPVGIWGGLWSLPECQHDDIQQHCLQNFQLSTQKQQTLDLVDHRFSHYQLIITPHILHTSAQTNLIMETPNHSWYDLKNALNQGLAAPVKKLIQQLARIYYE